MTEFNLHTIDTAPAESKDILQKINDKWGFIPNSIWFFFIPKRYRFN